MYSELTITRAVDASAHPRDFPVVTRAGTNLIIFSTD